MNDGIDEKAAHRLFSARCFNETWKFIDQQNRNLNDDARMAATTLTSLWHWMNRPDCTPRNLSIGYWQASRVFALLGHAESARFFAERCLENSRGEEPFYLAYAYEALARSAAIANNTDEARTYHEEATRLVGLVEDADHRQLIVDDLKSITL